MCIADNIIPHEKRFGDKPFTKYFVKPVDAFINKGGKESETVGRSCLCNNLGAAAGLPQIRKGGYLEPTINPA